MESKQRILITLGIGIVLVLGFFFITEAITKHTGFSISESKEDNFASCLKEQDITLYVNTNEPAKTLKNTMLFDYLQYFKIINCGRNNQECLENNINYFPTWVINNNRYKKDINLQELKEISGCNIVTK